MIYLVRLQAIVHVNLKSGKINNIETEQNNIGELYSNLCELPEIQKGQYTVKKVKSGNNYQLKLNGNIILQAVNGAQYYQIVFVVLVGILIVFIKCTKT